MDQVISGMVVVGVHIASTPTILALSTIPYNSFSRHFHPGLYEGVRFAWINMTRQPSRPFHITALRLVCQIKRDNPQTPNSKPQPSNSKPQTPNPMHRFEPHLQTHVLTPPPPPSPAQNWAGKFAAAGDDKLSRIWYLGAYTVKVNLLADQFGSILIYRGNHPATAA